MAITVVDKKKINEYLKSHAAGELYWGDMCDYIGKRGKITDTEFLEYFVSCVVTTFNKNEKISSKQTVKYLAIVEALLEWIHDDKVEISEDILDRIRSFKEFYDDYLTRNNQEKDESVNYGVETVLDVVNGFYPVAKNSESVSKYITQIDELNIRIKELEKELKDARRMYNNLQQSYEQKTEKADSLYEETLTLGKALRTKEKEIAELNSKLEELNGKILQLEETLTQVQAQKDILEPFKMMFEELKVDFEQVKRLLEIEQDSKRALEEFEVKQSKLEQLMYQKLLTDGSDVNELIRYLTAHGLATTKSEVVSVLKRLKEKINIDSSVFSTQPIYKVIPPVLREDGTFNINVPFGCKHYDVLLVSDFHIKEFNKKVLTGFDALNEYCVRNDISLILNAGDFFQGFSARPLDYTNAMNNYGAVEQAIERIPKADGIYHAILGGNHERNAANYGFDPIGLLAQEREDFISLGYTHSIIELSNPTYKLGKFDLHHPYTFDFPIRLDEDGIDLEDISSGYLADVYARQSRTREDSYIDIFGHTHRSQFNYPGSYYFLPPFFEGATRRGACHLRVYFDEDTSIKYMVFMPLSYGTKLVRNNEIIYQKTLKK